MPWRLSIPPTPASRYREESMLFLIWRTITITPSIIFTLTRGGSSTFHMGTSNLLISTGSHLETIWECPCLASCKQIISRGKPHINYFKDFLPIWICDLIDDRVPVQRFVLLDIAGVTRGTPQIIIGNIWSHSAGRNSTIEPVDVVAQAVPNMLIHHRVCANCSRWEEVHLEASSLHQNSQWAGQDQDQ